MFKKWFAFSFSGASPTGLLGTGSNHAAEPRDLDAEDDPRSGRSPSSAAPPPKPASFEQIYQSAAAKPPQICYGIPKVMEMVDSPHLAGMTPEAKRCALFMALDAAGAQIEDLLQDAVVRQRALNDYEEAQQDRLRDFEAAILEENRAIQGELDRITSQYMARIQVNVDEVARQQDNFRDWQKQKQQECRRMTDAASLLVPQGSASHSSALTAVLERASLARR
jgi:NADH:ubiquinone oxidoreductase subunit